MLHRTTSDAASLASPTSRRRRFGGMGMNIKDILTKTSSRDARSRGSRAHSTPETDSNDASVHLRPTFTHSTSLTQDGSETNQRQLQALVQRMRSAPAGPSHVDSAYKEFLKIKDKCSELCYAILQDEIRPPPTITPSVSGALTRRDSSLDSPRSNNGHFDQRSSFSGRSLAEVITGSGVRSVYVGEPHLATIRDWKNCLETLAEAFKTSLAETYKSYERDATQEMVDTLFSNKKFRKDAVNRMRNASVTRVLSADPQFFPRYEIRFRNYEKLKQELVDIQRLLQAGESGISPSRTIEEFLISPRGDAILEFANISADCSPHEPVLRFRVSSYMLAETSPIFARMFSGHTSSLHIHENEDITSQLPPPPVRYVCKDGTEAKLYRMPQHEVNRLGSLELLLHAAHMHSEMVPREIQFDQFVALAECCIKYKSTSPVELIVEQWLHQWMHKAADDAPDDLLVISYAFGLRELFTRMSKSAILNLVDEKDLHSKLWPPAIKAKIWAVRCAKVAQVHACCTSTIQDYIRQPATVSAEPAVPLPPSEQRQLSQSLAAPLVPAVSLTSTPRCPKGSHACDAANLGWMILMFNEINLLGHVMRPESLHQGLQLSPKSLAQLVDALRRIPGPPNPVHRSVVCDPTMAFRAAVNDIYNSVTGLTLYDISGKSHGWALSKHAMAEPQNLSQERMATHDTSHTVVTEFPEMVRLQILAELVNLEDLHAAAMINRAFYDTYKRNEIYLFRNILRADRSRSGGARPPLRLMGSNAEEKMRKQESDELKENVVDDGDALTLVSEDDGESVVDTIGDSDLETPAPSIRGIEYRGADSVRVDGGVNRIQARGRRDTPVSPRPRRSSSVRSDSTDTPFTLRQASSEPPELEDSSSPSSTMPPAEYSDIYEPPMTDEEARRILWPDANIEVPSAPPIIKLPPGVEGSREKFLAGEIPFNHKIEDKSLVIEGDKQLRTDHDQRVGLLKGDGKMAPVSGETNKPHSSSSAGGRK